MRHNFLVVGLVLAVLLPLPQLAQADTCSPIGYAANVRFINGVNNSQQQARDSARRLQSEVQLELNRLGVTTPVAFSYDYNQNEPLFVDFFDSALQLLGNQTARLFRLIAGRAHAPASVQQLFIDFASGLDASSYVVSSTAVDIVNRYRCLIRSGTTLIAVSHSQGNYYANTVYDELIRGFDPVDASGINIVAVATPAQIVEGSDPSRYTTLSGDFIWTVPFALGPNIFESCSDPLTCHNFQVSYLTLPGSRDRIVGHIIGALPNVTPTARFTMFSGTESATEGQILDLIVPFGGVVSVGFSADRSFDPDGTIAAWEWMLNGTLVSTASSFDAAVDAGTHQVSLVVTDAQGARSTPVQGTIILSEVSPPPVSTAHDDSYSMTRGTTLTVPAPGVLENDTFPEDILPVVDFQTLPPGSFDNLGAGGFSFTPDPSFVGTATFSYLFHTPSGDSNTATVKVDINAASAWQLEILRNLTLEDGPTPTSLIEASDRSLYGTTAGGAVTDANGLAFKIGVDGQFRVLHRFNRNDGHPALGLTEGFDGRFYGTTFTDGLLPSGLNPFFGTGTIFSMGDDGVSVLYVFGDPARNGMDGFNPSGRLTRATDGTLYGATYQSSDLHGGALFALDRSGRLSILHNFDGTDGARPSGRPLLASDGSIYGSTEAGETFGLRRHCHEDPRECGTLFKLSGDGLIVLHRFNGVDGAKPSSRVGGLVEGSDGALYGTTRSGGTSNHGTVFKIDRHGYFEVLHSFSGVDGREPIKIIQATDGLFYGIISFGGAFNKGGVFQMNALGEVTIIHSFGGFDGSVPTDLLQGSDGMLYGTAAVGGLNGWGVVFTLKRK